MTKAFERFLRSFSDDELIAFARDRAAVDPPYWRLMRLAVRIEADRRSLRFDQELLARLGGDEAAEDGLPATARGRYARAQ
jgi:hypothetical protein